MLRYHQWASSQDADQMMPLEAHTHKEDCDIINVSASLQSVFVPLCVPFIFLFMSFDE